MHARNPHGALISIEPALFDSIQPCLHDCACIEQHETKNESTLRLPSLHQRQKEKKGSRRVQSNKLEGGRGASFPQVQRRSGQPWRESECKRKKERKKKRKKERKRPQDWNERERGPLLRMDESINRSIDPFTCSGLLRGAEVVPSFTFPFFFLPLRSFTFVNLSVFQQQKAGSKKEDKKEYREE